MLLALLRDSLWKMGESGHSSACTLAAVLEVLIRGGGGLCFPGQVSAYEHSRVTAKGSVSSSSNSSLCDLMQVCRHPGRPPLCLIDKQVLTHPGILLICYLFLGVLLYFFKNV